MSLTPVIRRSVSNRPDSTGHEDLGRGKFDFHSSLAVAFAVAIDRGIPISVVTGQYAGCYESCLPMATSAAFPT
jgi:hypothetical protein